MEPVYWTHSCLHSYRVGANALHVLEALGVLEDVRAGAAVAMGESNHGSDHYHNFHNSGWFKFVSGMAGHELLLDVGSPF